MAGEGDPRQPAWTGLALADDVALSADQIDAIKMIFQSMRQQATEEGEGLIAGARALEEAFRALK